MRFFIFFVFLLALLLVFGYLVYLNRSPVEFVLTPEFKGEYYRIPPVPLGLLVLGSLIAGLGLGFLLGWLCRR